ncbi:stage II sporulation protein D [Bacillus sp. F19]|nr:stage II sporulation protein D [Bacillus sp. F19]
MRRIHPLAVFFGGLICTVLILPTLLVLPFSNQTTHVQKGDHSSKVEPAQNVNSNAAFEVAVYRTKSEKIEKVPIEDYVLGVVASEMPINFETEALKAQAIAARTFLVKHMLSPKKIGVPSGADISDNHEFHQVYKNLEEIEKSWGMKTNTNLAKLKSAIAATEGQILVYDGKPIEALFFSTSNGFTENSEDYFRSSIPYLKSVESPWDKQFSPKFENQITMSVQNFERVLGVKLDEGKEIGSSISKTTGNRVKSIDINGKKLSGKEIRDKLKLNSSDFVLERDGNKVLISTKGNGHGVGMSQYGANGMALDGQKYKDIIEYYYKGVEMASIESFIDKTVAKN